ncbi:MAG TPA: hypothetical protein VG713_01735, partial [Pirellulales bacterium]|nr:hypothetical protein [Pirellulales bacterium]
LAVDEQQLAQANDELLAQATALVSTARKRGEWKAAFSADQINGWLAVDVPENYPDLLGPEISEPRIRLEPHHATVACHYARGKISTVVSLDVEASMVEPNVLAVRIDRLRAGAMPLPLSTVVNGLTRLAADLEVPLRWSKSEGSPTALITLPSMFDDDGTQYEVESVEVRDGKLYLAGRTTPPGPSSPGAPSHPPVPTTAAVGLPPNVKVHR